MKNSTKFILILLALVAILIVVLTVVTRDIVNNHLVISEDEGQFQVNINADDGLKLEREYNFKGFEELNINGGWDILVIQSDEYHITVILYESNESDYKVTKSGSTLNLGLESLGFSGRLHGASATIYMPSLVAVDVAGAVNMNVEGFTEENLTLSLDGAGSITGEGCDIENFKLVSNGAVNIEFDESEIENADVSLDGAGNVQLNMSGGVLEGQLDGFANLEYSGEVSSVAVEKDGIGSISRKD